MPCTDCNCSSQEAEWDLLYPLYWLTESVREVSREDYLLGGLGFEFYDRLYTPINNFSLIYLAISTSLEAPEPETEKEN